MFRNLVEWVGTHPFATGLLAIIGLVGTGIGVFDVYSSVQRDTRTETQLAEISQTTQRSEQTLETSNNAATEIADKLDGIAQKIDEQAPANSDLRTAADGFLPSISELPYDAARPKLIEAGWIPNKVRWQALPEVDYRVWPLWTHGFEEIQACAGTGRGECLFEFHNGAGTKLTVVTYGEVMGDTGSDGRSFAGQPDFSRFRVDNAWMDEIPN